MSEDLNPDDPSAIQPPSPPSSRTQDNATLPALVLVSTPIGNLQDFSARAHETLVNVNAILCEDTRTSGILLRARGIATKCLSLHEHNEESRIPALIDSMRAGTRYALISDAGTPLVSDPGYRLVRAAIEAGLRVSGVPGPNAAVLALTLSGLAPHPFLFVGFLPPKSGLRQGHFARLRGAELAGLSATLIFYEAPHRLADFLADAAAAFGGRPAAVCRELTKRFEEVKRAPLPELAAFYAETPARGEICVVIGPPPEDDGAAEDLDAALESALASMSVKDAAAAVATATGLPKKQVYARALEINRKTAG